MSIIESIAANVAGRGSLPPGLEFSDLVSFGVEGLLKAHQGYNPDKGSAFKTYAYYRIRGEIYDRLRQEWQYRNPNEYQEHRKRVQERIAEVVEGIVNDTDGEREPLETTVYNLVSSSAVACVMSLDQLGDVDVPEHESDAPDSEEESILWEEVGSLEPHEQEIMKLFYVKGMKQKEIAEALKYSRSKVCRLHMKILEKLRRRLEKRFSDD